MRPVTDDGTGGLIPWQPRTLADRKLEPTEPVYWCRQDGRHLLYPGKVHWFVGPSETCKTWAALHIVAQALKLLKSVLVIDYEDSLDLFGQRLEALGVNIDFYADAGLLVYIDQTAAIADRHGNPTEAMASYAHTVLSFDWDLVILDGVTNSFVTEGLDPLSNQAAALWLQRLPLAIARATGAAVVCLDHSPKDSSNGTSRFGIGAQHKLAGITGAAFSFELVRPFARVAPGSGVDSHTGIISVTLGKDRPGYVRGLTNGDDSIGLLKLTSWADGGVTIYLEAPSSTEDESTVDRAVAREVIRHLTTYQGATWSNIKQNIRAMDSRKHDALKWLIAQGWVRVERKGQSHQHYLTGNHAESELWQG